MAVAAHVETTLPSLAAARRMASGLIDGRLAACVWLLPLRSEFVWKGKRKTAREVLLVAKTTNRRAGAAHTFLIENHPYDVPYIARIRLEGVPAAYVGWIRGNVRAAPVARQLR